MQKKKYLVIVPDGLADYPIPEYDNKTIMEMARTPNLDRLFSLGRTGLVQTIPDNFAPGSDIANMNVMGYDPCIYYSGRASIEALSLGIQMRPNQLAFRMNLVQVEDGLMKDYSADHMTTDQARPYIDILQKKLQNERFSFHLGTSYRHIFLMTTDEDHAVLEGIITTPPHDISGRPVASFIPQGKHSEKLNEVMNSTARIFSEYRRDLPGKATQGWLWGEGVTPQFTSFYEKNGLKGGIVTAVDLLKGIAVAADMKILPVEGITGFIDTNYQGKIDAAIEALNNGLDYVYVHIEAPDESGHLGNVQYKKQSLEDIDKYVFNTLLQNIEKDPSYNVLILPDHYTPIQTRTHATDPVPFLMIKPQEKPREELTGRFTEARAQSSGLYFETCTELLQEFYS